MDWKAKALELAQQEKEKENARLLELRDYFTHRLLTEIPKVVLNGHPIKRLPNNINVCFGSGPRGLPLKDFAPKGSPQSNPLDSEFLVIKLDTLGFAVSAASACHTLSLENGSYVIESLGRSECASSSLRITLGRDSKKSDLDKFISALKKVIK